MSKTCAIRQCGDTQPWLSPAPWCVIIGVPLSKLLFSHVDLCSCSFPGPPAERRRRPAATRDGRGHAGIAGELAAAAPAHPPRRRHGASTADPRRSAPTRSRAGAAADRARARQQRERDEGGLRAARAQHRAQQRAPGPRRSPRRDLPQGARRARDLHAAQAGSQGAQHHRHRRRSRGAAHVDAAGGATARRRSRRRSPSAR